MQRVRRGALVAVLALVGAFVLTGCRSEPGVAAYVGAEKITVDRVDAVLAAVDKINAQRTAESNPGPIPTSRQFVLGLIVYGDLAQQALGENCLERNDGNVDSVSQGYGIPIDHPYAKLLGSYFDCYVALQKTADTTPATKEQILRYYHAGVAASVLPAGASDEEVLANLNTPGVTADLNVQAKIDDLAKKQHLTVNPRYAPLPMPAILRGVQRNAIGGLPFPETGEPIVTDASEGGS